MLMRRAYCVSSYEIDSANDAYGTFSHSGVASAIGLLAWGGELTASLGQEQSSANVR